MKSGMSFDFQTSKSGKYIDWAYGASKHPEILA